MGPEFSSDPGTHSLNHRFLFCETSFHFKIPGRIILRILFWIVSFYRLMLVLRHQLCRTLCHPMDYSQAPRSMGFSQQEYWRGLPFPPPRSLPDPGIRPTSPVSPELAGGFFAAEPPGKSLFSYMDIYYSEVNLEEDLNMTYSQYQWHLLHIQIIYWLAISSQTGDN